MRRLGLAFVTVTASIVTVMSAIVTPALADVTTVCGMPSRAAAPALGTAVMTLSQALGGSPNGYEPRMTAQIALSQDDRGFDLIMNWRSADEHSLRAAGADIYGMELGANLVHLMVARDEESLEHFLFSLDSQGSGELLWSSETSSEADAVSSRSLCTKPH